MRVIWSAGQFDLCLDMNDKWVIQMDMKSVLKYNEDTKKWMGVKNGKLIKIEWPTFRDIINKYQEQ